MKTNHKLNTLTRLKTVGILLFYYIGTIIMKIILLIALIIWSIPMIIFKKTFIKGVSTFETFIKSTP